jgi:hypothetical protein
MGAVTMIIVIYIYIYLFIEKNEDRILVFGNVVVVVF